MNVPVIAMAMAAGISIDAALTHGLVGVTRRPRDAVRIAFAIQAVAVAAGALAVIAMYSAVTPQDARRSDEMGLLPRRGGLGDGDHVDGRLLHRRAADALAASP